MLNIKRKILVTTWVKSSADPDNTVVTYGKVNPVKMLQNGYIQNIKEARVIRVLIHSLEGQKS